jgi:hypothetical protein
MQIFDMLAAVTYLAGALELSAAAYKFLSQLGVSL